MVHRLFAYLHLSNNGLTENELIDLISLDDEVLTDVFQYSAPPLRRFPAALWSRIRNAVRDYMVTRDASGGKVIADRLCFLVKTLNCSLFCKSKW